MFSGILASKVLYSITLTLVHFLWQGALVALALKAALTIIPTQKSQLRYAMASLAMLLNLALPLVTFYFIYQPDLNVAQIFSHNLMPFTQSNATMTQSYGVEVFTQYAPAIALGWFGISLMLMVKLGIELYSVHRLAHTQVISPSAELRERFNGLVTKYSLKRKPQLFISLKTDVPMALGIFKPVVLLPVSMLTGLTPAQLDMLLLHELAHIRRHDYLVNIVQTLIETLLFFHPCIYWVSKQMRNEREYCSDDMAVKHCHDPIAYAHTLADTASVCHKHRPHSTPKMAMAAAGGDLKQRVLRLIKSEPDCSSAIYFPKGLALLTLIFMGAFFCSQLLMTEQNTNSQPLYSHVVDLNEEVKPPAKIAPVIIDTPKQTIVTTDESNHITEQETVTELAQTPVEPISIDLLPQLPDPVASKQDNEPKVTESYKELDTVELAEIANQPEESLTESTKPALTEIAQSDDTPKPIEAIAFQTEEPSLALNTLKKAETAEKITLPAAQPEPAQTALITNQIESELTIIKQAPQEPPSLASQATKNIEETLAIEEQVNKAELIKSIQPQYPAMAQLRGVELDVRVEFTINKQGLVEDIEFESNRQNKYFKSAIRSAMKKWRFTPAQKGGEPIESTMSKIFSFNLLS